MAQHFWVVGTDTDVGKTMVTAALMRHFQTKGNKVIPYKPVQTGVVEENNQTYNSDTTFYQSISEQALIKEHVNSYSLKEPASPHYAAMLEGVEIDKDIILRHINWLKTMYDIVICEGAGGLYVPLEERGTYVYLDLIQESQLPVVIVTRTTLGTINHTLLSLEALRMRGIPIAGIVFNGFEGTHLEVNNVKTILSYTDLPSLTIPRLMNTSNVGAIQIEDGPFFERLMML